MDDVVLGDVADVRTSLSTRDADLSCGRLPDADHRLQQRGLPGAATPDDRDDLARRHRERDVAQRGATLCDLPDPENLDGGTARTGAGGDSVGCRVSGGEHDITSGGTRIDALIVCRPHAASLE